MYRSVADDIEDLKSTINDLIEKAQAVIDGPVHMPFSEPEYTQANKLLKELEKSIKKAKN